MPLFWLSLAFLSGILLTAYLSIHILIWILIAIASLLLILPPVYHRWAQIIPSSAVEFFLQIRLPSLIILPLLPLFMALGGIRYLVSLPAINPSFAAFYNDQPGELILEGVLMDPPDLRDSYTNLRVNLKQLRPAAENKFSPVHGLLLARVSPGTSFSYGDRIRLEGLLVTPLKMRISPTAIIWPTRESIVTCFILQSASSSMVRAILS